MTRLSSIAPGESAEVVALAATCRGAQRRRLLDLGLVPGTRVTSELRGPSGDPTAYRIRGALIALRRDQAHHIFVHRRERRRRMSHPSPEACAACPAHHLGNLQKLGVDMAGHDYVVALAGNPNTGKSTVFNALTGLRQHTGNWPGKTVTRAEGGVRERATSGTSSWTCPAPTRCSRRAPTRKSRATSCSSAGPT